MNLALFQIEEGIERLLDMLDEADASGALPEEKQVIEQALAEYFRAEVKKVDGTCSAYRALTTAVSVVDEEILRLKDRRGALQARADRIKANALEAMQFHGVTKLETPTHSLIVQGNGGLAPLDVNGEILPDHYRDATVIVPRDMVPRLIETVAQHDVDLARKLSVRVDPMGYAPERIREALKRGETVPGAVLKPRGVHLRIS